MPGNFYSETPADELRRVKAELSRERALVAGLADAAKKALELIERIQDEEGFSPSTSVPAHALRSALSELEKSK